MSEKSLGMKRFGSLRARRRQSWPSSPGLPESLGMERTKKTAPTEAVGHRMDAGQDGKTEILADSLPLSFESI